MENEALVLERTAQLINALQTDYEKRRGSDVREQALDHELAIGKKYIKLIQISWGSRSIHTFIDKKTGEVYKPASFKAPAKHVRYKLLDDQSFQQCIKAADWAGGYLYIK